MGSGILLMTIQGNIQGVSKKCLKGFLGKTECYFPKLFLNSKISCTYNFNIKKKIVF